MTTKAKLSAVSSATRAVVSLGEYGRKAAGFVLDGMSAECLRVAAIGGFNATVVEIREAGVKKVGDRRNCPMAMDFHATIVAAGNKPTTANNYLTTFREAVATGKPITEWNSARAKAKAKGKGGAGKGKATLESLLLKAFNHAEFKDMCEVVQAEYDDAKGDMHVCIESWLTAMGAEIK